MEQECILAAALSAEIGWYNTKLFAVANICGSLMALQAALNRNEIKEQVTEETRMRIATAWQPRKLTRMAELLKRYEIVPLLFTSSDYPVYLLDSDEKPYVLYYQGNLQAIHQTYRISCVGARLLTPYGRRVIDTFLRPLKGYPLVVTSGLALGVDGEAHRVCLDAGITTVGVLAGGLDRYEPQTNQQLAEGILKAGGCLISEYPPGVRPQKHHFLERNRIIAALSQMTVVVEGKEKSGSLVTAHFALKYGREVASVPGDIFRPTSVGPNRLLRDGAHVLTSAEDLCTILSMKPPAAEKQMRSPLESALSEGPKSIDTLIARLSISVEAVQQELLLLELEGKVAQTAQGEYYSKA